MNRIGKQGFTFRPCYFSIVFKVYMRKFSNEQFRGMRRGGLNMNGKKIRLRNQHLASRGSCDQGRDLWVVILRSCEVKGKRRGVLDRGEAHSKCLARRGPW